MAFSQQCQDHVVLILQESTLSSIAFKMPNTLSVPGRKANEKRLIGVWTTIPRFISAQPTLYMRQSEASTQKLTDTGM